MLCHTLRRLAQSCTLSTHSYPHPTPHLAHPHPSCCIPSSLTLHTLIPHPPHPHHSCCTSPLTLHTLQLRNDDGAWIQVPRDQVQKYRMPSGGSHDKGYCLVHHAGKENDKLLDEVCVRMCECMCVCVYVCMIQNTCLRCLALILHRRILLSK